MPLTPPELLKDRYRLIEQVGAGGMAVVYRAHDERLARDVAIKFLATDRVLGEAASARFLREAQVIAGLAHPNIMTLYDADRADHWHFLVLEYIPGQDLRAQLVERGAAFEIGETLTIIRAVLAAIGYAHAHGVIHRDIKPANIMFTPSGQVKLTDFGLALTQADVRLTQEGTILGTALYMAPEALSGEEMDRRSDLYAVGAVLYELVTGRAPFSGDSLIAIASQVLNTPPTPPHTINPRVPQGLEDVIMRLLAKDPGLRYASAQDVLNVLPDQVASLPEVSPDLSLYAAQEDQAAALEAERRRLAGLLQSEVIESLNLLLAQANAYEMSLGGPPQTRLALSVLTSLTRQTVQQALDLAANLHPTTLDALGLEPALESLADQVRRAHGLQVTLAVERLAERLAPRVELALLRITQDALDRAVRQARASQVTIRLVDEGGSLLYTFSDNGTVPAGTESLRLSRQRVEQLGGAVSVKPGAAGGLELAIRFEPALSVHLTPREIDVLRLIVEGLSNKEIATALDISPRTVNFHLDNVYSKLGVSTRTEAAIYALRAGLAGRSFYS
jgi:serine/threonine protein kinase/DNA-binding NarL/FixJ family response regulator